MNGLEREYADYLGALNIHLLRNVAREVGVHRPTFGTKEDIILRTIAVLTGQVPPVSPSHRGAPRKGDCVDPKYKRDLDEIAIRHQMKTANAFGVAGSNDSPTESFDEPVYTGILEIQSNGCGYLLVNKYRYTPEKDIFIPTGLLRSLGLRQGDFVACVAHRDLGNNNPLLEKVLSVNETGNYSKRSEFSQFSPCYPVRRFSLFPAKDTTLKLADVFAPLGRGQRVLLNASDGDGAQYLTALAKCVHVYENRGEKVKGLALLCSARPERITEFQEAVKGFEIVATSFDESPQEQIRIAELLLERAQRLAESGNDVVLLIDSLPKLVKRADLLVKGGKMLPCGVAAEAMTLSGKIMSSARALKNGGSLTVVALIEERTDGLSDYINSEYTPLCNGRILLRGGKLDLSASYTERAESLRSTAGNALAEKLPVYLSEHGQQTQQCLAQSDSEEELWYLLNKIR